MPRLQILHHKSYHPYNEKNKQRVREDEARAQAEAEAAEQRALDVEAKDRLDALRRRAGSPGPNRRDEYAYHDREREREKERAHERRKRDRLDFDFPSDTARKERRREKAREADDAGPGPSERSRGRDRDDGERGRDHDHGDRRALEDRFQSGGHLNFWAEDESAKNTPPAPPTAAELAKRKAEAEADKFTVYLARPQPKAWYADRDGRAGEAEGDEAEIRRARDRRREVRANERNDPLNDINATLAAQRAPPPRKAGAGQSEKERARALLAKKAGKAYEAPRESWTDELERQKDTAGHRFTDTWVRRQGRG